MQRVVAPHPGQSVAYVAPKLSTVWESSYLHDHASYANLAHSIAPLGARRLAPTRGDGSHGPEETQIRSQGSAILHRESGDAAHACLPGGESEGSFIPPIGRKTGLVVVEH